MRMNLISLPKQLKQNKLYYLPKKGNHRFCHCFLHCYLLQRPKALLKTNSSPACSYEQALPQVLSLACPLPKTLPETDSVTAQTKLYYSRKLKIEIRDSVTAGFAAIYCKSLKFC